MKSTTGIQEENIMKELLIVGATAAVFVLTGCVPDEDPAPTAAETGAEAGIDTGLPTSRGDQPGASSPTDEEQMTEAASNAAEGVESLASADAQEVITPTDEPPAEDFMDELTTSEQETLQVLALEVTWREMSSDEQATICLGYLLDGDEIVNAFIDGSGDRSVWTPAIVHAFFQESC